MESVKVGDKVFRIQDYAWQKPAVREVTVVAVAKSGAIATSYSHSYGSKPQRPSYTSAPWFRTREDAIVAIVRNCAEARDRAATALKREQDLLDRAIEFSKLPADAAADPAA